MKKALLWLCPLACLALACLYAYAWFTRDPLVVAFERIEVGMTVEEAEAIIGRPADSVLTYRPEDEPNKTIKCGSWRSESHLLAVFSLNGRVDHAFVEPMPETIKEKMCRLVRNPSSLWNPAPPVPFPNGDYE